ncbi:MAG TPA: hypothetical protein VF167_13755 [Longimicrobiaceae bacterium]
MTQENGIDQPARGLTLGRISRPKRGRGKPALIAPGGSTIFFELPYVEESAPGRATGL